MTTEKKSETEIKVQIADAAQMRERIVACGGQTLVPRHLELNWVFDFPGQPLKRSGILLRLRQAAGKSILTLKTPPSQASAIYKVRCETEVEVVEAKVLQAILCGIGLEVFFHYEKFREVISCFRTELMLDETPIGCFLEVEGTPAAIDRACQKLGFSRRDYLTASYFKLFRALGREGHMVFPK